MTCSPTATSPWGQFRASAPCRAKASLPAGRSCRRSGLQPVPTCSKERCAGVAWLAWWAILFLPVLFSAGMSLLDSIDGSFMNSAYGWAF